jgi:RHH-type proline utilization regulon transcriptional repressor/proline dehydrogenase/delta 1-pyrroline-5-carboxylate dehydrogenase
MFTGSTDVGRLIQKQLSTRLSAGRPIPLIAETGGQNAMIVDSSALAEQVVADVIASAFDSAGQRCSALRVLCLQEDVADRVLAMLKGALAELRIGRTDRLAADIGPVITAEAQARIEAHVDAMRARGARWNACPCPRNAGRHVRCADDHRTRSPVRSGTGSLRPGAARDPLSPTGHRRADRRDQRLGFGLTFGLHTRLDDTIAHVTSRIQVGNIYVNRNVIGAVVGVQPFGGHGLSGTGPKAGGPLYLQRLVQPRAALPFR